LDEDLFAFGLTLPHELKARRGTCKRVLRSVAKRWLPEDVARKPKRGFAIPVDHWVEPDFKPRLRASLLGHSTALADFLRPESYRPIIDAFCSGTPYPGVSRQGLYQRAIMLLSLHLTLERRARRGGSQPADRPEPPSVVRTDGHTFRTVMSAESAWPLGD
jgi:asparagine synthase (glutamine-hydrolysing)